MLSGPPQILSLSSTPNPQISCPAVSAPRWLTTSCHAFRPQLLCVVYTHPRLGTHCPRGRQPMAIVLVTRSVLLTQISAPRLYDRKGPSDPIKPVCEVSFLEKAPGKKIPGEARHLAQNQIVSRILCLHDCKHFFLQRGLTAKRVSLAEQGPGKMGPSRSLTLSEFFKCPTPRASRLCSHPTVSSTHQLACLESGEEQLLKTGSHIPGWSQTYCGAEDNADLLLLRLQSAKTESMSQTFHNSGESNLGHLTR